MFQKLILIVSTQSDHNKVTEPIPLSRTYFKQNNPSEVKVYLYHRLNIELNLPIYIPSVLATTIYIRVLFWEDQDTPLQLSDI